MEFTVDKKEVFTLSDWEKALIKNDIPSEVFESDMTRRVICSMETPIFKCIHYRKKEIIAKLKKAGIAEAPSGKKKFAQFLGNCKDICSNQSSFSSGCSIGRDGTEIYIVCCSYLTFVKSLMLQEEVLYLKTQLNRGLTEKINGCLRRLHLEWDTKLSLRYGKIPLDDEAFVNLVVSQSDYKDRSARVKNLFG